MALVHSYDMIAKTGSEEALALALQQLADAVKSIAGSEGAMVLRDRNETQRFLFLEFWRDEESRRAAAPQLPKSAMGVIMASVAGQLKMAGYDQLSG